MKLMRTIPVLLSLVALVAACSHAPRLNRGTDATAAFRAEYLQHNPNDVFAEQIMRGEVDKGMNSMQVIAAWGLPNVRRSWKDRSDEHWIYYTIDPYTRRMMSYELVFANLMLDGWIIDNNVRGLGTLTPEDLIGEKADASAGGTETTGSGGLVEGSGPIKK